VQAGLTWALKLDKPEFLGKEALQRQLELDEYSRIAGLVMEGRAPAREGYNVWLGDSIVGTIRSGSIGPSVGNKNIATALVAPEAANVGTSLAVEIRGTRHDAKVVPMPFYKRPK
jgi:aminomethyltransferase